MPKALSNLVSIAPEELASRGVFNTILDVDSRFFINFMRVKDAKTPDLSNSYDRIVRFFRQQAVLLRASKQRGDKMYRTAYDRLEMAEFRELCLGYSVASTAGAGSGSKLKRTILATAKEILDAGVDEPEIFELVGLFEEGIGPDRISDMIGRIIQEDLVAYSRRIVSELKKVRGYNTAAQEVDGLLLNPHSNRPVILIPQELLHELPVAREWDDIDTVCTINAALRQRLNELIGDQWKKLTVSSKKGYFRRAVLQDPSLLRDLIEDYRAWSLQEYDFVADPLGEAIWYSLATEYANHFPLRFAVRRIETIGDLRNVVSSICAKFRQLMEENGLNQVLYTDEGKPRHERIAQKTFHGIADAYCDANDIDISPEVNSGRGPVDFKFSVGASMKIVVEVKLTTNHRLVSGYEKQLSQYALSERTENGYYLVIDNGGPEERLEQLRDLHEAYRKKGVQKHELIVIDARVKPSASKL